MPEFTLLDDGTADTVVECFCDQCGRTWEERFSDTSEYRDPETGCLDEIAFFESLDDIYCECEEETGCISSLMHDMTLPPQF